MRLNLACFSPTHGPCLWGKVPFVMIMSNHDEKKLLIITKLHWNQNVTSNGGSENVRNGSGGFKPLTSISKVWVRLEWGGM